MAVSADPILTRVRFPNGMTNFYESNIRLAHFHIMDLSNVIGVLEILTFNSRLEFPMPKGADGIGGLKLV